MILARFEDALILDKPAGVSTHTPDGGATRGFLEMASMLLDQPLWAVHRLDRDTSGCLLVTTKAQSVDKWTQALAQGKKKYIFISPHESHKGVWSFEGRIEKTGNHRFGLVDLGPESEPNSQTTFAKLGSCALGTLYEAEISTGKTHQIRIHAQASEIPILGDNDHGGDLFPRLMLHSKELELNGHKTQCDLPKAFNVSEHEKNTAHFFDLVKFLISLDRRRFLMDLDGSATNCFRLVHREWTSSSTPKLTIEKLGDVLQVMNYVDRKLRKEFLLSLAEHTRCTHWFVREMFDRGKRKTDTDSNIQQASADLPIQWVVTENKMKFDLRYGQGMSSGLFLDQRDNRKRVLHDSQGKRVANLFSYTCAFSVAAALGGAHEVVSVDTSTASLEWGRNNFKINNLDPEKYEFFDADALFFLNACLKRKRVFDLIILDPPTFSRSKRSIFRLKEDLPDLLDGAFQCLSPDGKLLVTLNDESFTVEDLAGAIEASANRTLKRMIKLERYSPPYDFEFPTERDTVLKGFWVSLSA